MNDGHKAVRMIQHLVARIRPSCADRATLDELDALLSLSPESWGLAYDLFQRIRQKTLLAFRQNDKRHEAQYCFEEVCAKTLYNLSGLPAPFDTNSASKIVPNAVIFGHYIDISEAEIMRIASV